VNGDGYDLHEDTQRMACTIANRDRRLGSATIAGKNAMAAIIHAPALIDADNNDINGV
jgi:hypothetical protein